MTILLVVLIIMFSVVFNEKSKNCHFYDRGSKFRKLFNLKRITRLKNLVSKLQSHKLHSVINKGGSMFTKEKKDTSQSVTPNFPKKSGTPDEQKSSKEWRNPPDTSADQASKDRQSERESSSSQGSKDWPNKPATSFDKNADDKYAGSKDKSMSSERRPNTGSRDDQNGPKDRQSEEDSSSDMDTEQEE